MDRPQPPDPPHSQPAGEDRVERLKRFLNEQAWFIVRNLVGWVLILASPVLGAFFPGPGGLPVFLIGFALVTFPGKRKLTARVLRGRRLRIEDRAYAYIAAFISILVPGIALWILAFRLRAEEGLRIIVRTYAPKKSVWILSILIAILITWAVTRLSLQILNGLLRLLPKFRRKFRPWLRKKGLNLLPPRRRKAPQEPLPPDEILEISQLQRRRAAAVWSAFKPWVRRVAAVVITVWIFAIMVRPLRHNWATVREQMSTLNPWRFVGVSVMFALFLLCFRALAWRRVLKGFGYKLPYGAATRIWATSELARYLPGAIWQVVGRVYLAKPYGVPGSIISTSQVLEICIFLMANVLVAMACLLWFGQKMLMSTHARPWLIVALLLVPALGLLLHPKIFYGAAKAILRKLGKPEITKRLGGRKLVELLGWMILGLLWQSMAVYLLVDPVLHLKMDWWWSVAGAYCLAWCAGFLAFWAPGGIGVRELVFVATMQVVLPLQVRQQFFPNAAELAGLLVLLGFLLRLWTVSGELILMAIAYLWDLRGAMNRPDAPGRVAMATTGIGPAPALSPVGSSAHADAGGPI